ncbi:hypothetical protein DYBT9623_02324 [Dyadobacter sp. CECT 9623]|jgi:hypothetical protein|uniref:Uncharacterized protein n=1 Tax=Dyadobacter linearis TaxID=2823330 RepID=A0ABM8UQ10_9BACT|nr:hypothetical protein DYBT9623_02324 [Dyadobacter sp. CECT 9623]
MRPLNKENATTILSAEKLVQQELKIVNAILKKVDLSKIRSLAKAEANS